MKNREKTKKRPLILAALLMLIIGVFATGIVAFAATRWFNQSNKTDNTVTVDHPVIVTVSGAASSGVIMPGVDTSKVTTTFDVSITGAEDITNATYKLVIKNVDFAFADALKGSDRDDGDFDDENELTAIFGAGYTDFSGEKNAAAFAAFLAEFIVEYNGVGKGSLAEGMAVNPDAATASGQTIAIRATDDLQFIARGGTLTFTIALEVA